VTPADLAQALAPRGVPTHAGLGIDLEVPVDMRKTNKKSLALSTQTVRNLQDADLTGAAGGYNSYVICPPTSPKPCAFKTPNCPQ
jgi:hypothetical protein